MIFATMTSADRTRQLLPCVSGIYEGNWLRLHGGESIFLRGLGKPKIDRSRLPRT